MLVGRERERAHLTGLLARARLGTAGSLVLRGEPGVGKTALLDALVDDVVGTVRLLRTQGLQVEAPLAYAALHRLLRPVTRLREQLSRPQARALRVAFGEEDGPAVEPFLVAVATLSMLTAAAEEDAVLCVVDDAHWLDAATAEALLFCARRLDADRVLLLFAARDGASTSFRADGLPKLTLTGLDPAAARALLARRNGGVPPPDVADRLVAETGGNPLALLELPGGLTPDQFRGASPLPARLPLTIRLEQAFLDRSRLLPAPVRSMLLLAAADDSGDRAVIALAAAMLGLDGPNPEERGLEERGLEERGLEEREGQSLVAAVGSGLLDVGGEVVNVRHPLVRSALYQAATEEQRRAVHRALADALAERGDHDREAWHRAYAAKGPSPEVAAALQVVGSRAERRGAHASALAAYRRAAASTDDVAHRAELTLAAARNAWASGQSDQARALVTTARHLATGPLIRSDVARLHGRIEVNAGSASDAHRIFVEAAHAVHPVDQSRALEMAVAAAVMRTYGAHGGLEIVAGEIDVTVSEADPSRTACLKHMLVAMTRAAAHDWSGAVAALDGALARGDAVADLDVLGNLGNAALQLGDDAAQQHFYALALLRAREAGAVITMVYALNRLCFGYLLAGDWSAVRSCAAEALSLSAGLGQQAMTAPPLAWLTLLAALQRRDDYDALLRDLEDVVDGHPLGILTDPVHDLTRWARGARASAEGDTFGALHQLSRLRLPALTRMAAPDRIDAAARAGELEQARAYVGELAEFADGTRRPWALATLAFGRAVTGMVDAERWFRLSLEHHAHADRPYDEARTHLAYGEWLRRAQRRVEAREHLRLAMGVFGDVHAEALAERAAGELRASGETPRRRDPSTLVQLTPMELRVAQLVSSGLSNKEAAAQIWVSPRTVAFHLRNVFAKTGVTSRGELARLELG